jgi:hypothetical protein
MKKHTIDVSTQGLRSATTPADAACMDTLRLDPNPTAPLFIFGLNFNKTPIPDGYKKKFAARISGKGLVPGYTRGDMLRLVGVAGDARSRDHMLIQANNGRRFLHVVERKTAGGPVFGIYTF